MEADTADIFDAATAAMPRRLRVKIADRDSGFVHTVVKRLPGVAMEPVLADTIDPEALAQHRLDALVLDIDVVGDSFWPGVQRLCERLPALAVVVCTGRSSVAQRVRALRLASMRG
jgi:DNA-binding response OmpR family regulator